MMRGLLLCLTFLPMLFANQDNVCSDPLLQHAWESSPAYSDGMHLGQLLESRGFKVDCMRRSKEERLFEGQKGAAWIKTDHGTFEAWFLPGGQTFQKLAIQETSTENGRYLYSFSGLAHVPSTFDGTRPMAFIKARSVLFVVFGNAHLAADLRRSFSSAR